MEARSLSVVNPGLNTPEGAIRSRYEARQSMRSMPKQKLPKPKKESYDVITSPREKLRASILKMSLFPNLYNKEFLLKGSQH